jgi:glutamate synthase (NADPH/NADH) small chain
LTRSETFKYGWRSILYLRELVLMKTEMPLLPVEERVKSFREIELGFSAEQAIREAGRCLQCKNPTCIQGCPAGVDCKAFIEQIMLGNFDKSFEIIVEKNPLPCFTGRVCAQEAQCEGACILAKQKKAIAIKALERFVAGHGSSGWKPAKSSGKKIAIVGSGPAGMAASIELRKKGHSVKVFEALPELGGILSWGIPGYRLDKRAVEGALKELRAKGVEFKAGQKIGTKKTLSELMKEFDAVLLAIGEGRAKKIELPGIEKEGVLYWDEFLQGFGSGGKTFGEKKAVVVGGGNTALDCARVLRRLGCGVTVTYRKNMPFMPCNKTELVHAMEEGIEFRMQLQPEGFLGKERLERVKFRRIEIEKEEFVETQEFEEMEADVCVLAIGQEYDASVTKGTEIEGSEIKINGVKTELWGVFAAGDLANKEKTVVHAIASAKNAVEEIESYLGRK